MRLGFLTTRDPLYLPAFFDQVLANWAVHTRAVYSVQPLYHQQTAIQAAWRYFRTFGGGASWSLALHLAQARFKRQSIQNVCQKWEVPYKEVKDVNAPEFLAKVRAEALDVLISVSCPQIFRAELIRACPSGILNIHGALLPRYRGVMPGFWMLANQESKAGVSIYFVNEAIDAGNLCAQRAFGIEPRETLHQFLHRSKAIAAELLQEALLKLRDGHLSCQPLNLAEGSYYSWPSAADYRRFRSAGRRLF